MSDQLILTTFEAFLDECYPVDAADSTVARAVETEERQRRLSVFPYAAVLQLTYPAIDFANRWCWQQFGPEQGECHQHSSLYPACQLQERHIHEGTWKTHWLEKTGYHYGFNEWCFSQKADKARFLEFVPNIALVEKYGG